MSPEEQAAVIASAEHNKIEAAAVKYRDAALAYPRQQAPRGAALLLRQAQEQCCADEQPGSPWDAVGQLCAALIAAIESQPIPPVPPAYAGHLSAVQSALKEMQQ